MSDAFCRFIVSDALTAMREMPDASVDLVLSSPPFLALRSYLPADHPDKAKEMGSEPTPGAYIDALLDVVEECRRVLAPHGSLCLELGDTFAGSGGAGGDYNPNGLRDGAPKFTGSGLASRGGRTSRPDDVAAGLTHPRKRPGPADRDNVPNWPLDKSLCLIPESLRWAMVYGRNPFTGRETPQWRARNVVRWVRPNPPVGALGDKFRPATTEMVVACMSRERWFDLDAVRAPGNAFHREGQRRGTQKSLNRPEGQGPVNPTAPTTYVSEQPFMTNHPAGAPPLDWWEIPTEPTDGRSVRRVRVPLDGPADGIQRTASPDCPVHVSSDRPGSNGGRDERVAGESTRIERSGDRHEPEPPLGFVPTPLTPDPSASTDSRRDHAAIPHSSASRRTGHVPATTPAGTPSAGSPDRTGDTSTSPESSDQRPDIGESSTAEACPPADGPGSGHRTSDTSDPSPACTCSYWVEVDYPPQDTRDYATWPDDYWVLPTEGFPGAHYATWPRDLCVIPVKAMCPARVCVVCGEPSRRAVSDKERFDINQPRVAAHIRQRREELGFTQREVNEWFGYKAVVSKWEGAGQGECLPSAKIWATLKDRLGLSDEFDDLILGERTWTESLVTYDRDVAGGFESGREQGRGGHQGIPTARRLGPNAGWTDCGHGDQWRAGVVLDPFAGSGTTLAVAQGHGRSAIGIDLDPRNLELARTRIGMFLEEAATTRPTVDVAAPMLGGDEG